MKEYFAVDTTPVTYNGSEIKKVVVCKNSDLREGRDYEVSYDTNINAGTGKVIITGLEAFADSELVYEFTINKAQPVLDFVNNGFEKSDDDDAFTLNPYMSGLQEGDVVWSSDNPEVAEVDPDSGEVTVRGIGTANITASFEGDNNRNGVSDSYSLTVDEGQTEVYVDRVVYVKVPVEVPGGDGDDDQTDDKPETVYIEKDNDLYIWLLIVMAVICVCFAAYILYSHRDQEGGA